MIDSLEDLNSLPVPKGRHLDLYGDVDGDTIAPLVESIRDIARHDQYLTRLYGVHGIEYKPKPIVLHISSYGGSVLDGFSLISVMKSSSTPVDTVVEGYAMSMGLVIASQGCQRSCHALSTYMLHQMSTEMGGRMKDIEEDMAENSRIQSVLFELLLDRTKLTKAQLNKNKRAKKDWYFGADEALNLGLVDQII